MSYAVIGAKTERLLGPLLTNEARVVRMVAWTVYRYVTGRSPIDEVPRYLENQPAETWTWYGYRYGDRASSGGYRSLAEAISSCLHGIRTDALLVDDSRNLEPRSYALAFGVNRGGAAASIKQHLVDEGVIEVSGLLGIEAGLLLDEAALDAWVASRLLALADEVA